MSTTNLEFTGKKGDIRVGFGFKRLPDRDVPEPTIYLIRGPTLLEIPGSEMWRFDETDRDAAGQILCMPLCDKLADILYGYPMHNGGHRILDVLNEFMTDLKNMPPPSMIRGGSAEYMELLKARGIDIVDEGGEHFELAKVLG
jgi:hypothetical protein